jgi:hypothetical protein
VIRPKYVFSLLLSLDCTWPEKLAYAARKLTQFDKPCPGIEAAIANSISMAEKIMRKIDALYPAKPNGSDPDGVFE